MIKFLNSIFSTTSIFINKFFFFVKKDGEIMLLNEIAPKQGKINIELEVVSVEPAKEFQKFGQKGRVAVATVKDDSGEMKMTLWNDEIDFVKPGIKIRITNGYCNEFQGEKQLTAGRFGKLEVI